MIILTLDIGTRTGWCSDEDLHGVADFRPRRGDSSGMRFIRFASWFKEMLKGTEPSLVVYEQPFLNRRASGNAHAAEIAFGMAARVQELCEKSNVEYAAVNVAELKRFATGKGNASKEMMRERLGADVTDDNEVDAIWLWQYAKQRLS